MMKGPRHFKGAPLLGLVVLFYISFPASGAELPIQTQQEAIVMSADMAKAMNFYRQGKVKEAIVALQKVVKERKTDALAWHYLGLSFARDEQEKEARKAFENAVKLKPDFAAARAGWAYMLLLANKNKEAAREAEKALTLDSRIAEAHYVLGVTQLRAGDYAKAVESALAARRIDPTFANAFLLESQALVGQRTEGAFVAVSKGEAAGLRRTRFKEAANSLEKFLQLRPEEGNSPLWREQLEALRYLSGEGTDIYTTSELTTKARILGRPEPKYTERARSAGVEGTVVLRAVFAADGKVKYIYVLKGLVYGLTEEAIKAARKIRFTPATKDGRPVSQYIQIEYNFNLY